MSKNIRAEEDAFSKRLLKSLLEAAVGAGQIDPKGKTDTELRQELDSLINVVLKGAAIRIIVDHREKILSSARQALRQGDDYMACLMYSVWTEHCLNNLINVRATAVGLTAKEIKQMIRSSNIIDKTTWLLPLSGLPRFSPRHAEIIRRFSEHRNAFVHYKWSSEPEEEGRGAEEKLHCLVASYEKTVKYLQRYESQHLMKKARRRLHRVVRGQNMVAV